MDSRFRLLFPGRFFFWGGLQLDESRSSERGGNSRFSDAIFPRHLSRQLDHRRCSRPAGLALGSNLRHKMKIKAGGGRWRRGAAAASRQLSSSSPPKKRTQIFHGMPRRGRQRTPLSPPVAWEGEDGGETGRARGKQGRQRRRRRQRNTPARTNCVRTAEEGGEAHFVRLLLPPPGARQTPTMYLKSRTRGSPAYAHRVYPFGSLARRLGSSTAGQPPIRHSDFRLEKGGMERHRRSSALGDGVGATAPEAWWVQLFFLKLSSSLGKTSLSCK